MKSKSIILLLTLFMTASCGVTYQTVSMQDKPFVMVYDNLEGSKDQLFLKANEWLVRTFTSSNDVIEYSDKEEGVLIGKYLFHGELVTGLYGSSVDTRVYAKIDIRVKDSKARISIEPLGSWKYDSSGMTIFNYSEDDAMEDMQNLAASFYEALLRKGVEF